MRPTSEHLARDRRSKGDVGSPSLVTVGHGTLTSREFVQLLEAKGVQLVVDVRSAPGSRRHPQLGRAEIERWLSAVGIDYHWEQDLGGLCRPLASSVNTALRHPSFRGYAGYMATDCFRRALTQVLGEASHRASPSCAPRRFDGLPPAPHRRCCNTAGRRREPAISVTTGGCPNTASPKAYGPKGMAPSSTTPGRSGSAADLSGDRDMTEDPQWGVWHQTYGRHRAKA
jgi:hypothetical protein